MGLALSQSESRVDSDEISQQQAVSRDFLGGRQASRNGAAETYAGSGGVVRGVVAKRVDSSISGGIVRGKRLSSKKWRVVTLVSR